MREIKFRAWDTIENVMVVPEKIINPVQTEAPEEINCFILMQFTGLKDKKGKDIFEGDILMCDWCFRKMPSRGYLNKKNPNLIVGYSLVEFDRGEFSFKFLKPISEHEEYYSKNKQQYAYIGYTRDAYNREQVHVEVVGNIYETPNLMSGRHDG